MDLHAVVTHEDYLVYDELKGVYLRVPVPQQGRWRTPSRATADITEAMGFPTREHALEIVRKCLPEDTKVEIHLRRVEITVYK